MNFLTQFYLAILKTILFLLFIEVIETKWNQLSRKLKIDSQELNYYIPCRNEIYTRLEEQNLSPF